MRILALMVLLAGCGGAAEPTAADMSSISWTMRDTCGTGATFRYFDTTAGTAWPAETLEPSATRADVLACAAGAKICFGAQAPDGRVWGVGLDGTLASASACATCQDNAAQGFLGCPTH